MKSVNTKGSAVIVKCELPAALEAIVAQVACALHETTSLSETLGDLTRQAGAIIKKTPDMLDPFVDGCRQMCAAHGLTEGSFKVYLSNIRGVIRAMVGGFKPKAGQSLRAMYDAAPKGTGRQAVKTGARHETDKVEASDDGADDGETVKGTPVVTSVTTVADERRKAMIVLFGHADDELDAALAWAKSNEVSFVRYVKASIAAAHTADMEKLHRPQTKAPAAKQLKAA